MANHPSWMGPFPAVAGCDCHVCRPDGRYDEMGRRTIETVLRHGWQVIVVGEDAGCRHPDHRDEHDHAGSAAATPTFGYTIGLLHRAGHPELLMSGLDPGLMHRAINHVAERISAGLRLEPGDHLEDVLAGVPIAVEQVAEAALADTVTWAGWFHRRKPDALALVWPDRAGVFAWQPGGAESLTELQPPGWRVPIEHSGGLAVDPPWPFPVPPDHLTISCTHVVERGDAVLWVARQHDDAGVEQWTAHCGTPGHATAELLLTHLAHLVRSAPALRLVNDLALEHEALRDDVDAPWVRSASPPAPGIVE